MPPPDMSALKDWAQLLSFPVAVIVATVGLIKAFYEIKANRAQRHAELLWKKVNTANELLDDIHKHELAKNAVHMLDWYGGSAEYDICPGASKSISYQDVLKALKTNHAGSFSKEEVYIRDCFDWFFYRVDRIEHYIRRKLIDFEDVKGVFVVYAQQFVKDKQTYDEFLDFHRYELAKEFFKRYEIAPQPR